jgi:hypothetical protein
MLWNVYRNPILVGEVILPVSLAIVTPTPGMLLSSYLVPNFRKLFFSFHLILFFIVDIIRHHQSAWIHESII